MSLPFETTTTPETVSFSRTWSSGAAVSLQSDPATVSFATVPGPTTIFSEPEGGFAMVAVAEEDGRSEMVQELSFDNDEDIEILEAEEIAAQRAAEAAGARVRVLKARAGSSRSSAPAASRSYRRPSSYADVSERSPASPDPLPVPLPAPPPIQVGLRPIRLLRVRFFGRWSPGLLNEVRGNVSFDKREIRVSPRLDSSTLRLLNDLRGKSIADAPGVIPSCYARTYVPCGALS